MRQILSIRFLAALVALVVLAAGAYVLMTRDEPVRVAVATDQPRERRADLVSLVYQIDKTDDFGVGPEGRSTGDATLVFDGTRSAHIYPGTPGQISCPIEQPGACGVLLELLGDAVVSFDLVPLKADPLFTIELPPVRRLEGGLATLTNGWQVPYAPVIERDCDTDTDSFREFLEEFPRDHVAVFDLGDQRITQVICQPV